METFPVGSDSMVSSRIRKVVAVRAKTFWHYANDAGQECKIRKREKEGFVILLFVTCHARETWDLLLQAPSLTIGYSCSQFSQVVMKYLIGRYFLYHKPKKRKEDAVACFMI